MLGTKHLETLKRYFVQVGICCLRVDVDFRVGVDVDDDDDDDGRRDAVDVFGLFNERRFIVESDLITNDVVYSKDICLISQ